MKEKTKYSKIKKNALIPLGLLLVATCANNKPSMIASAHELINESIVDLSEEDTSCVDVTFNVNDFDLSSAFEFSQTQYNENGDPVEVTISYTPEQTSRATASAGTWNVSSKGSFSTLDWSFTLSKSGSDWTISNVRNMVASYMLGNVANLRYNIGVTTSSGTTPAEATVMGDYMALGVLQAGGWSKVTVGRSGTITATSKLPWFQKYTN